MLSETTEYFAHLVSSHAAQVLSVCSLLAYYNLTHLTWFPLLPSIPWGVLMYFNIGDTAVRDRIVFVLVYIIYHAIVMLPLSTTLGIPMPFAMLSVYLPLLVYYDRRLFIPPFLRKINDYSGDFMAQQMMMDPSQHLSNQSNNKATPNPNTQQQQNSSLLSMLRVSDFPDANSPLHNCYLMLLWTPPFLISHEIIGGDWWNRIGMRPGGLFRPLVSIINDELCMGPLPHYNEVIDLYKDPHNVRAVVNCCVESMGPLSLYRKYDIHFCRAPTPDMCQPGLFEIINTLRFVNCWLDTGLPPVPENQRQSVDPAPVDSSKSKTSGGLLSGDNDNSSSDDDDDGYDDCKDASQENSEWDTRKPVPKEKRGRVFVHCMGGQGRSTAVMLCILIQRYRMSAVEAMDLIKSKRDFASRKVLEYPIIQQFIQLMEKNDYRV